MLILFIILNALAKILSIFVIALFGNKPRKHTHTLVLVYHSLVLVSIAEKLINC